MEKVQWNSIDKKQNGLKYSKNDKSSTLPRNTSGAQHFYPIKITTTWNALPSEVVSSRTCELFQKPLGQTLDTQMSELTGSNHWCRAQFKCVQTVVGQCFAGNGPNGLSYYYCSCNYYYYYYYISGSPFKLLYILKTNLKLQTTTIYSVNKETKCLYNLSCKNTHPYKIVNSLTILDSN